MLGTRKIAIGLTLLAVGVVISIVLLSDALSRSPESVARQGDGAADPEELEAISRSGVRHAAGEPDSPPSIPAQDGTTPAGGYVLAPIFGGTEVTPRVTLEELLGDPSNFELVQRGLHVLCDVYDDVLDDIEEQNPAIETLSFSMDAAAEMSLNGGLALTLRRPELEAHHIYVPCPSEYVERVSEIQSSFLQLVNSDAYVAFIESHLRRSLPDGVDASSLTAEPLIGGRELVIRDVHGNVLRRADHNIPAYVR